MSIDSGQSCPACEYEKVQSGHAIQHSNHGNGEFLCLECGNTWKEFGVRKKQSRAQLHLLAEISDITAVFPDKKIAMVSPMDARILAGNGINVTPHAGTLSKGLHCLYPTQKLCLMITMLVLVASLAGYMFPVLNFYRGNPVRIESIQLQERTNADGDRVLLVHGLMENVSSKGQLVPAISIVLRRNDGGELYRWRHKSSISVLRPGAKAAFISSLPVNNPQIAYAEASIDK